MKGFRSIISNVYRLHLKNMFHTQSNMPYLALIAITLLVVLISHSCRPELSVDHQTNTIMNAQKQLEAAKIEDNIKNSYARLAANRTDICPKLLQKDMGSSNIERVDEVMVDDYCDYFLYLDTGQRLDVDVDNRQIEALLIVPTIHNFANGEYQVASYDKHVIRLAYNGATYKPERLSYDVAITVTD
ncbi:MULTISPECIES: hypothetical protein [unclassified Psychrobacter]|uniref:hypothetical protein n=1 Tax=unclassified Psychrobacter TaxID=196806 RepID=UPI000A775CE9|nr:MULTISPECIES: hypothetical protein [unclassified Psychrobacter]